MNTAIVFDTLQYAKKAEMVGFTREQAEFQAEEIAKVIDEKLTTKRDLDEMANKLTIRFGALLVIAVTVLSIIIKL